MIERERKSPSSTDTKARGIRMETRGQRVWRVRAMNDQGAKGASYPRADNERVRTKLVNKTHKALAVNMRKIKCA